MPKISVIIPNYNCKEYLARAIDSVLNQTFSDFEIIVIDDASTDGSAELLQERYGKNEKVTILVNGENRKLGAARNRGLEVAKGDYIFFLDSDDWLEKECFADLASLADKEKADVAACGINKAFEKKQGVEWHNPGPVCYTKKIDIINAFVHGNIQEVVWNKLYCRELIEKNKIRFIEPHFHEDHIFTFQILHSCQKYVSVNKAYYNYFQRDNSIVNQKKTGLHLESYFRFITDGFNFLSNIDFTENNSVRKSYETVVLVKFVMPFVNCVRKYFGDFSRADDVKFLGCAKKIIHAKNPAFYSSLLALIKNKEIAEEDIFAFLKHDLITRKRLKNVVGSRERGAEEFLYTVVSPVKNHQAYLDDYFESLMGQSLCFREKIKLILVDYGSIDVSGEIIKRWQKVYPGNIEYVKIKEGSQAIAKNIGLQMAYTRWVTFISPEDFVSRDYFEKVATLEKKQKEQGIGLITCKPLFYQGQTGEFSDHHPLNIYFKRTVTFDVDGLGWRFLFSVKNTFFLAEKLKKIQLEFDERIGESFEDAHFIGRHILLHGHMKVAFLAEAQYFVREKDQFSAIEKIFTMNERFRNLLQCGHLDLLKQAQEKSGNVPVFIQRMILFNLAPVINYSLGPLAHKLPLSDKEQERCLRLLREIGDFLDNHSILDFHLLGCWLHCKLSLIQLLKGRDLPSRWAIAGQYDEDQRQLCITVLDCANRFIQFYSEGGRLVPFCEKVKVDKIWGRIVFRERIFWLPVDGVAELGVKVDGVAANIFVAGSSFLGKISVHEALIKLKDKVDKKNLPQEVQFKRRLYQQAQWREKYRGAWMLIDRDTQAGDNAEHLYRYIAKKHPEINQFFVLKKESHDWERLKKEGFRLIAFGSEDHEALLLNCKHLVSSHTEAYITDFLPRYYYGDLMKFKFTFLQHGVIKDDLSGWLNTQPIDCFVTTTRGEYDSIAGNENGYKFTSKEVVLAGLPRHDALLAEAQKRKNNNSKTILVMPTWRKNLVGNAIGPTNIREALSGFMDTTYAKAWQSLLNSQKLRQLTEKYGFRIVFFPHANMQSYLAQMNFNDYVQVLSHKDVSIQGLFQDAAMVITDYSSAVFDVAYLKKPVVYYQFDREEFSRGHLRRGYFDYHEDGFGAVCEVEEEVLKEIENILGNDCKIEEEYKNRIEKTFVFHNQNNCQRVFNAIKKMEGIEVRARSELKELLAMSDDELFLLCKKKNLKKQNPVFSVIVSCYNSGKTIRKTILSLLLQTFSNFEIIIVDDESNDRETVALLDDLKKYLKVLYTGVNGGPSKARNVGVKASRGKYLCYVDADDMIGECYLENAASAFENSQRADIVAPVVVAFGESGDFYIPEEQFSLRELLLFNRLPGPSCIRREVFDAVGGYDENLRDYEDWEFWIRVFIHNKSVRVVTMPEQFYFYRISHQSSYHSMNEERIKRTMNYIISKHNHMYEKNAKNIITDLHAQQRESGEYIKELLSQVDIMNQEKNNLLENISQERLELRKITNELKEKGEQVNQKKLLIKEKDELILSQQNDVLSSQERLEELRRAKQELKESKSFRIGDLFFRSIRNPWKMITFPFNLAKILIGKSLKKALSRWKKGEVAMVCSTGLIGGAEKVFEQHVKFLSKQFSVDAYFRHEGGPVAENVARFAKNTYIGQEFCTEENLAQYKYIYLVQVLPDIVKIKRYNPRVKISFIIHDPVLWVEEMRKDKENSLRIDHFFSISKLVQEKFLEEFPDIKKSNSSILYNSFCFAPQYKKEALALASEEKDSQSFVWGYAGRFSFEKNTLGIIKMFDKFSKKHPRHKFILAGDVSIKKNPHLLEYKKEILKIVKKNDSIEYWGYQKDLSNFYKKIDGLIMASFIEGMSVGALDSLAYGVPVLTTDVGSMNEIIEDDFNGQLVRLAFKRKNPFDDRKVAFTQEEQERFISAMDQFWRKEWNKGKIIERVYEKFSQKAIADNFRKVILKIINN